jgi:quercetin 2,3-dioxygenase
MPAVTADTLTLPRLPEPAAGAAERPVAGVTAAPSAFEGEGFPVRRAFAGVPFEALDPFIHLDQMGAVDYGPGEPRGTDWHPHRGFETVTYMLDGTFQHQDSNGGGGVITDGATQWMTAGGGILHIETPPEDLVMSGGLFHGLQLWVNLPSADKMAAPRYQSLEGEQATLLASEDGGALVRVIAGDVAGHAGPGVTHTPITFLHATVAPGARLHLPWRPDFNALAYVLSGSGRAGSEGRPVGGGDLVVFGPGDHMILRGDSPLEVVVLGGQPIREPIAWYGPFVMNTRAEVVQAVEDYQAGRLGAVPAGALMPHRG